MLPPEDARPLDEMTGAESRAHALKHGYVLDDTLANMDMYAADPEQQYPWEDVDSSRRNRRLQAKHPVTEGQSRYLGDAKPRYSAAVDSSSASHDGRMAQTWIS